MNELLTKYKTELSDKKVCKINNQDKVNHNILKLEYEKSCINFFKDKYNNLEAVSFAEQTLFSSLESEKVFVDWLSKE